MKRIILLLFITMLAGRSFAALGFFKEGNLYYDKTSESTVRVTPPYTVSGSVLTGYKMNYYGGDYSKPTGNLVIPETITHNKITYSVTEIDDYAFYSCSGLKSVTIPNTITSIGQKAFYGCVLLSNITIPNSVTIIGHYAFTGSGLESITLSDSITRIDDYVFMCCNKLKSITIPNTITSIGENAFCGCANLTSVFIPSSVKTISSNAFSKIGEYSRTSPTIYCEAKSKPDNWHDNWTVFLIKGDVLNSVVWGKVIWGYQEVYTVTVSAENGTVEGSGLYNYGDIAILKAYAATGYHFVKWSDENTDNQRRYSVTSDTALTAIFEEHTVIVDTAIAATCTTLGYTEGSHCSVCYKELVSQNTIPALGHKFANYVYNNDATTEADGTETATCEHGCGATDTRVKEGTKLPEDHTAVAESATNNLLVYATGKTIIVENATDEILVYDAMGHIVGRDVARNVCTIRINNSGVYIVKTGNVVKRVMVN